jgi:exo-beta-1,3-glucanase (GH17 family)
VSQPDLNRVQIDRNRMHINQKVLVRRGSGARAGGLPRWFALLALACAMLPMLAFWWWQGRPVAVVDAPGARVPCVSFAPYEGGQTPFDESLVIPPAQIERDLRRLSELTDCVRTYAVDQGLDQVPAIAERLGLKVMLGAWIGREREKNERELARVIDLARTFPETVSAVIVGNEVLLRREQPPEELTAMIRRVADAVAAPVTYADVWEFWQRHPEVAAAVDFVTIHTLPYWEDEPTAIDAAVPHVERIWRTMSASFPGTPVLIGEAGWPSAGRMREGALPSQVNQARFVRELMRVAEQDGIGLNLIESFDQPWKRKLEGTVGGHWGLYDAERLPKFPLSGRVSDDPDWLRHAALAAALSAALLLPAVRARRRLPALAWLGLAGGATGAATLLVLGGADGLDGVRTIWDWAVFAVRWGGAALAAALLLETLAGDGRPSPPLPMAELIACARSGRRPGRLAPAAWRQTALGAIRAAVLFGAAASTLCLVFDPRYREFANALYAVPGAGFLLLAALSSGGRHRKYGPADLREETLLAGELALGGLAVLVREGLQNHQALAWTATVWLLAAAVAVERWRSRRYPRATASAPSKAPPAAASGP